MDRARWENFQTAIQRAVESCEVSGHAASDHFRDVTKMVTHGKGVPALIAAQSEDLDALKSHNTGLMQQLLPALEAVGV